MLLYPWYCSLKSSGVELLKLIYYIVASRVSALTSYVKFSLGLESLLCVLVHRKDSKFDSTMMLKKKEKIRKDQEKVANLTRPIN